MPPTETEELKQKILEENRRVHAKEGSLYLNRHPEQTNRYQTRILKNTVRYIRNQIPEREAKVLDLGCGTGYLYLEFLKRGFDMTGVDLSEELIDVLKKNVPKEAKTRSRLEVADVLEFAENDSNTYDAIVLSALLHHLYDYDQAIEQFVQKLNPGGWFLVFFEPLKQDIDSPIRYQFHRWIAQIDEWYYKRAMNRLNIPIFEEDYHLADFQRQQGGIDPHRVVEVLKSCNMEITELKKYCARRHAFPAFLTNSILHTQNTFNLLARKPKLMNQVTR